MIHLKHVAKYYISQNNKPQTYLKTRRLKHYLKIMHLKRLKNNTLVLSCLKTYLLTNMFINNDEKQQQQQQQFLFWANISNDLLAFT